MASTGANGTADCGVTFRQPGDMEHHGHADAGGPAGSPRSVHSPPPANCTPVPGAELNPVNWARNVTVHEIQAANGAG